MRLFTGIELPINAREHLATSTNRLLQLVRDHSVRKTSLQNIHITLRFLGEVSDTLIPQLCERLTALQFEPATIFANRFLFFPARSQPRIIAAGFAGETGRLVQLHARVEAAC